MLSFDYNYYLINNVLNCNFTQMQVLICGIKSVFRVLLCEYATLFSTCSKMKKYKVRIPRQ